jgi:hypothetical protein
MRDQADPQSLLAAGVPLSLLADLVADSGPASDEILDIERPSADDMAWLDPQEQTGQFRDN